MEIGLPCEGCRNMVRANSELSSRLETVQQQLAQVSKQNADNLKMRGEYLSERDRWKAMHAAASEKEAFALLQVESLKHAAKVAKERAVELGDRLIERGGTDQNRGQFLSLMDSVLTEKREGPEKEKTQ